MGTIKQINRFCGQFLCARQIIGALVAPRGPAKQICNQGRIVLQVFARVGQRCLQHLQRCRRLRTDRVHLQGIEPAEQIEQHTLAPLNPVESGNRYIALFAYFIGID